MVFLWPPHFCIYSLFSNALKPLKTLRVLAYPVIHFNISFLAVSGRKNIVHAYCVSMNDNSLYLWAKWTIWTIIVVFALKVVSTVLCRWFVLSCGLAWVINPAGGVAFCDVIKREEKNPLVCSDLGDSQPLGTYA